MTKPFTCAEKRTVLLMAIVCIGIASALLFGWRAGLGVMFAIWAVACLNALLVDAVERRKKP